MKYNGTTDLITLYVTFLLVIFAGLGSLINETYASNTDTEKVEQVTTHANINCNFALTCTNSLNNGQTASAFVTNAGSNFEDSSNSAEIEQEGKQLNKECTDSSSCENNSDITQVASAFVTNTGSNFEDASNSASEGTRNNYY